MNVHSASSVLLYAASMALSQSNRQHAAASPANTADTVSISQAARDLYASVENQAKPAVSAVNNVKTAFDTTKGRMDLDIESYFASQGSDGVDLDSVPPLLPSQKNIEALSNYLSAHMPGFMADKGIPTPPAGMTYDSMGQIELPADYPYAAEFKPRGSSNRGRAPRLRLTGHFPSTPFSPPAPALPPSPPRRACAPVAGSGSAPAR